MDVRLQNLKVSKLNYKAYFLVYSGDDISDKKYREYISKLRNYVKKNVAGGKIEIIEGTRQKSLGVVIFLLPVDYPAPVPKAPPASD